MCCHEMVPTVPSYVNRKDRNRFSLVTPETRSAPPADIWSTRPTRSSIAPPLRTSPPGGPLIRCLFVTWNDGHPASQFSVPDDYTLISDHHRTTVPGRVAIYNDQLNSELYLDLARIRSAYLMDMPPDRQAANPELIAALEALPE